MKIVRGENKPGVADDIKLPSVEFLHSGATVLNLAGSNKGRDGGWARGRIINFVGDGSSGKTLLALELSARCFYKIKEIISKIYPGVKRIRIRYINAEQVMDFPVREMYNLRDKDGNIIDSFYENVEWVLDINTVEEMGRDLKRTIDSYKPGDFILYIVDSLDALTSEAAKKRFADAAKKDKEEDGSYNLEKAKYLSQSFFANICADMSGKDITIVFISQVRQKIGVTFGEKQTRAGGKSLDFYTHQVVWLSELEKLKRQIQGDDWVYGIRVLAKFKRNKAAKPFREAEIIILFDYGLDDVSSSLAWLYGPKVKEMMFEGQKYSRLELISHIEENRLEENLAEMVEEKWEIIDDALRPDRKAKF